MKYLLAITDIQNGIEAQMIRDVIAEYVDADSSHPKVFPVDTSTLYLKAWTKGSGTQVPHVTYDRRGHPDTFVRKCLEVVDLNQYPWWPKADQAIRNALIDLGYFHLGSPQKDPQPGPTVPACTCDIRVLMDEGCSCGGFEAEMRAKNSATGQYAQNALKKSEPPADKDCIGRRHD